MFGSKCNVCIHRILPGLTDPADDSDWGTVEIRPAGSGHSGSDRGKLLIGYSPLSHVLKGVSNWEHTRPTSMRALRQRTEAAFCTLAALTGLD